MAPLRIVFCCAAACLLAFNGQQAHAQVELDFNTDAWTFAVTIEPNGENAKAQAVNLYTGTWGSHTFAHPTAIFKVQGKITIHILAIYNGTHEGGTDQIDIGNTDVRFHFENGSPASASATIDTNQLFSTNDKTTGYFFYLPLRIRALNYDPDAGGETFDAVDIPVDLGLWKFRHVWGYSSSHPAEGNVGVFDVTPNEEGGPVGIPVVGETLSMDVVWPRLGVEISPPDAVTEEYGDTGIVPYMLTANPFVFAPGVPTDVQIKVEDRTGMVAYVTVPLPFAYVLDATSYGAFKKDPLSGHWRPVLLGTRQLNLGDELKLELSASTGEVLYPWIRVLFADGHMEDLQISQVDPSRAGTLLITVGGTGAQYRQVGWTVQFENFLLDAQENHRQYMQDFVWDRLVDGVVSWGLPQQNWIVRQGVSRLAQLLTGKGSDIGALQRSPNPVPRYELQCKAQGTEDAPEPAVSTAAGEEEQRGVLRYAVAPPRYAAASRSSNLLSVSRNSADTIVAITGGGNIEVENRSQFLSVSDDNGLSTVIGPQSGIIYSAAAKSFTGSKILGESEYRYGGITITPASGSTINSRTPLLSFDYDYPALAINPETLELRINGVLQQKTAVKGVSGSLLQVGSSNPLREGSNTIEAYVAASNGTWFDGTSVITAHGAVAAPSQLAAYTGAQYVILTWAPNSESDIVGYHVHHGASSGSIGTRLTAQAVAHPVFIISAAQVPGIGGAPQWFAVTAVTASGESAPSSAVSAQLNGAVPAAAPGAPLDLSAVAGDGVVDLTFTRPADAVVLLVERSVNGGVYSAREYIASDHYSDSTVLNGNTYRYRLTPLGRNLTAGPAAVSAVVAPQASAPPPPTGFTARRQFSGAQYFLRWDPSTSERLAGYNVYASHNGAPFSRLNNALYTNPMYWDNPRADGLWRWAVSAVDSEGRESALSTAQAGSRGCPLLPALSRPPEDSDGDGVSDSQEVYDGSDPQDAGSLKSHLQSPIFAMWTGFLDIVSIAEIFNPGTEESSVRLTLVRMDGTDGGSVDFALNPGEQRDIIAHDLAGFAVNSYGLFRIHYCGAGIDGRVSYYRSSANGASYDFAYSVPFSGPLYGASSVGFNTFQPSASPADAGGLAANWLTIVNLAPAPQHFSLARFDMNGVLLSSAEHQIAAGARIDLEAGHENPGPNKVGLIRITPADPNTPYLANVTRFGYSGTGRLNFAFPLSAKAGSGRQIISPLTTTVNTQNWLEVINTSDSTVPAVIETRRSDGVIVDHLETWLGARSQVHLNVNARLGENMTGLSSVFSSASGSLIAQSMVYIRDPQSGSIRGMYGSQGREALGTGLVGSYNLFLGMYDWLKLINPTTSAISANLVVHSPNGARPSRVTIPASGSLDLGLHEAAYGTVPNSYGVVQVQIAPDSPLLSELLRLRMDPQDGGVDFAFPTQVRDANY